MFGLWAGLWRDLVLNTFIASPLVPLSARWRLLRLYGLEIERSHVSPRVWFGSKKVAVGAGSFINRECLFTTLSPVVIGRHVYIAMRCTFITESHQIGPPNQRAGELVSKPIVIGDGAWIGANVTILAGVTVGSGSVVAAGSLVTASCMPNKLYAGVPAKAVRDL